MVKINDSLYANAKRDYGRKFGKYKPTRLNQWQNVDNKEPMVVLQEYRELCDQIKDLNRKRKSLKEKLNKLGIQQTRSDYFNKSIKLYVLKLEHNCWYVGMSRDVDRRFKRHLKGKGAQWTLAHKPISIHEIRETGLNNDSEVSLLEDELTLDMARMYGMDNVRGGGYCQAKPRWPASVVLNGIL